jgi:hypothetical protein
MHKKAGESSDSVNVNDVNKNERFVRLRSVSLEVGFVAQTLCAVWTGIITNVCRSLLFAYAFIIQ